MLWRLLVCLTLTLPCMAQSTLIPNLEAQRAAMKKLYFLSGKWSGEGRLYHKNEEPLTLAHTEDAQFKQGGLLLIIEGVGRTKEGKPVLQAFGIISSMTNRKRTECGLLTTADTWKQTSSWLGTND